MTQNLISLDLPAKTLEALDQAIATLEAVVAPFITLSPDEVRGLVKMGGKSEQFCRQTLVVLDQNQDTLPPSFKLAEVRNDLAAFDAIRPRLLRVQEVLAKMQDTQTALGSDVLMASLEGYALMKMFGKSEGLEALRQAMAVRRPVKAATKPAAVV
jgi:hypothetical protein